MIPLPPQVPEIDPNWTEEEVLEYYNKYFIRCSECEETKPIIDDLAICDGCRLSLIYDGAGYDGLDYNGE